MHMHTYVCGLIRTYYICIYTYVYTYVNIHTVPRLVKGGGGVGGVGAGAAFCKNSYFDVALGSVHAVALVEWRVVGAGGRVARESAREGSRGSEGKRERGKPRERDRME
jgi:hypothetical protein